MLRTVDGLDEKGWQRSGLPLGWMLAGLVEHLGGAEWHWFQGSGPTQPTDCPGMRACLPKTRGHRSSATSPRLRSPALSVARVCAQLPCGRRCSRRRYHAARRGARSARSGIDMAPC
ncbi:MAG: DUF664 domain-containing protein [Candidatus Dormibacteraeota bacterium]|nr:DUF664 domain-containing protein [Candidatus Dormibacteraeota bacterium]